MRHQLAPAHWTNTSPPECMSGLFRTLIERSHSATVRWNRSDNESQSPQTGTDNGRNPTFSQCDNSLTSVFPIVRSRHRAYEPVITMRHILWYRDVHRRPHHRRMEARPSIGQGKDRRALALVSRITLASPLSFAYQNSPESSRLDDTGVFCWFVDPKNSVNTLATHPRTARIKGQFWLGLPAVDIATEPVSCLFPGSGQPDHVWTPGETQTPCEWTENHELKQINSFVNRGHVCFICFLKLCSGEDMAIKNRVLIAAWILLGLALLGLVASAAMHPLMLPATTSGLCSPCSACFATFLPDNEFWSKGSPMHADSTFLCSRELPRSNQPVAWSPAPTCVAVAALRTPYMQRKHRPKTRAGEND
ncbi:uncharacterized protein CIMG_03015 [Coccidioides immitis RS]|uniref:Uncharacterized protein n=1 Tax=Coccidioides immitis (strain RS) TaxID=246410 RepID=J3KAF1_COCIM|nr:uncharacterized protein CIMG_03015 [Coccidioides immitis RS]EAS31991.3 hypothetical protein CIMG_03015 [Coccidioides immitis RS]